jgi:hypothetical protein
MITDVDCWDRGNFGRRFQCFATDEEVQTWLLHCLPSKYAPYRLVGCDRVPGDGAFYVDEPFQCEVGALLACMHETDPPRWKFFIWSETLTPDLRLQRMDLRETSGIDKLCGYNGLVELQFGTIRGKKDSTGLVIVDKVRNLKTGELGEHREYLELFQALRKEINRALCYGTLYRFADGSEWEDARMERWTEGAVRSYREGLPFLHAPGRPSEKRRRASTASAD